MAPARKGWMEPVVYILAIMGCHEGYAACEPLAVMPTRYETAAACDLGSDELSQRPIDLDYDQPIVVAECLRMDAAAAALLMTGDVRQLEPAPKVRPERRSAPWISRRVRG